MSKTILIAFFALFMVFGLQMSGSTGDLSISTDSVSSIETTESRRPRCGPFEWCD